jgi:hypothetical protein
MFQTRAPRAKVIVGVIFPVASDWLALWAWKEGGQDHEHDRDIVGCFDQHAR